MSITIRQLCIQDSDAVDPLLRAAYAVSVSRSAEVRRNLAIQPDGWLLAEEAGVPVGMVGVTNYGSFAYVGLMAVDPRMQRRGIGQLLMEVLISRNYPTLRLDATSAGAPLYRRVGFVEDGEAVVYEQPDLVAPMAHPRVRLMQPADMPAVIALDTPIFGADRSRVLLQLLSDLPERAFVFHDVGDHVGGFLFAQSATLGPWVATTPLHAEALLTTALAWLSMERPHVLVQVGQPYAETIVTRHGFVKQRTLIHMRRGEAKRGGQIEQRYGQTSFALG
jgi:predicted N-acetyltransferase YhbS